MKRNEEKNRNELIDGGFPYGGQYELPEMEIVSLTIKIDGKSVVINKKAYQDLFNINTCLDFAWMNKVEAFESLDGEFIYVYITGGQAAGSYFSKLVFNKDRFITKIVANYYDLSTNESFRPDFIGF